jgi:hypothetical protein
VAIKGIPLALTGTVEPVNATNQTIVWTVTSAGTTGAAIVDGNKLQTTAAGTVTVTAAIAGGQTACSPDTKQMTVTVNDGFVPVSTLSGVPTTAAAGTPRALTGTVEPANATNQTIAWTVTSAGTTGAVIVEGNKLQTTVEGTVKVTASIVNGLTASSPYTQDFDITVDPAAFVAVSAISGVPTEAAAGTLLALTGTVEPEDATNKTIVWTVKNAGTTGAAIVDGNKLQTTAPGTVTVTAAITNGLTASSPYTQDFPVEIKLTILSYTVHSYDTVKDITFGDVQFGGAGKVSTISPYANNEGGNNRQTAIGNKLYDLLCQMQVQGDNLKAGYNAVATAYPNLQGLDNIIDGQSEMRTTLETTNGPLPYLNNVNTNVDSILNGILADRTEFNKYLDAYKTGHYFNQKILNTDGSKDDAEAAYTQALTALGFTPTGSIDTDLNTIQAEMLTQINGAMGITSIGNANHRAAISGLNNDLIMEIQDLSQLQALVDDVTGPYLHYDTTYFQTFSYLRDTLGMGNGYNYDGGTEVEAIAAGHLWRLAPFLGIA